MSDRDAFRNAVFARDNNLCIHCSKPAVDAHHLIERRLWSDGGYHLDNGVSLCAECHLLAESTELSVTILRDEAGISKIFVPDILEDDWEYDKWGNVMLPDGTRLRGPLFWDESVQKVLKPVLHLFKSYVKYPRTVHLPWSHPSKDDAIRENPFTTQEVIITEKLDGENITMYTDYIHARSLESGYHASRTWVKNFHAKIAHDIPKGYRIIGENMYAVHSIQYTELESYFYGISMWNEGTCLSWSETLEWFALLGIIPVPVLYEGRYDGASLILKDFSTTNREGYVIRLADSFKAIDFSKSVAKYVRPCHVTSDTHWRHSRIKLNSLKN